MWVYGCSILCKRMRVIIWTKSKKRRVFAVSTSCKYFLAVIGTRRNHQSVSSPHSCLPTLERSTSFFSFSFGCSLDYKRLEKSPPAIQQPEKRKNPDVTFFESSTVLVKGFKPDLHYIC